jgi:osmoprotectant transport system ATP-binding protein
MNTQKSSTYPVVFKSVHHYYNKREVLHNIDLTFKENKITVILGRSGSGKSTLLQMINGMLIPDKGHVEVFGKGIDYEDIYRFRRAIGYSVQGTGLFPHMTINENIVLLAKINKCNMADIAQRIDQLMQLVGLDQDFKRSYPHQLSGGEQQRVGICRAMILNPRIFLLDEAFGALDVATRQEIHTELLTLQKAEPRTIILVTHDVNEAMVLADKILFLDQGMIQQYAEPEELMNNPLTPFIDKFMHSSGL